MPSRGGGGGWRSEPGGAEAGRGKALRTPIHVSDTELSNYFLRSDFLLRWAICPRV